MNVTTVDIGTNTVLVLEASCVDERLVSVGDHIDITRLGEGLDRSGRLAEAAIERTVVSLATQGRLIRLRGADRIAAVATEAVRKAANADEFLARAGAALGHPIEVIDGEREAWLSWLATSRSLPDAPGDGRRTVVDIGGGSTELVRGRHELIERSISIPIGSVRLTERLLRHDPPAADEKQALVDAIDAALATVEWGQGGDLVGIAGTVTTICAIYFALPSYDPNWVHGRRMARSQVEQVVERLGTMPADERRHLPGLDPRRADVIYAGGAILCRVMASASVEELVISDRGIRWGLAYEIAEAALGRRLH